MRFNILAVITSFVFLFPLASLPVDAQTKNKISPKVASLISHVVKETNLSGNYAKRDLYLSIRFERTEYIAELKSGRIVAQRGANAPGGGFCGDYAEVGTNLLDQNKRRISQGGGQLLKLNKGKWSTIAVAEGDYSCQKLRGISQSVMKCLKIDCIERMPR